MNPDKQRIAIAEACGWKIIHDSKRPVGGVAHQIPPGRDISWFISVGEPSIDTPDYLNDLNAMHEAFRAFNDLAPLTRHQWWQRYWGHLAAVLDVPYTFMPQFDTEAQIKFYNATAAQKAEAFLRTIGKWEET